MYKPASMISPLEFRSATSKEKVENVVKPPITPVVRNSLACCGKPLLTAQYSTTSPMANEPRILIHNVPTGYCTPQSFAARTFTPWRRSEEHTSELQSRG